MNANLRSKMLKYFSEDDMLYFENILYMFRADQNWDMMLSMLVGTNMLGKLILFLKEYYELEHQIIKRKFCEDQNGFNRLIVGLFGEVDNPSCRFIENKLTIIGCDLSLDERVLLAYSFHIEYCVFRFYGVFNYFVDSINGEAFYFDVFSQKEVSGKLLKLPIFNLKYLRWRYQVHTIHIEKLNFEDLDKLEKCNCSPCIFNYLPNSIGKLDVELKGLGVELLVLNKIEGKKIGILQINQKYESLSIESLWKKIAKQIMSSFKKKAHYGRIKFPSGVDNISFGMQNDFDSLLIERLIRTAINSPTLKTIGVIVSNDNDIINNRRIMQLINQYSLEYKLQEVDRNFDLGYKLTIYL